MGSSSSPGLRPSQPIIVTPRDFPGDQCKCAWSFIRMNWHMKYANSACLWKGGPEGPHYLLALRIAEQGQYDEGLDRTVSRKRAK
jgi:hypothetical protein